MNQDNSNNNNNFDNTRLTEETKSVFAMESSNEIEQLQNAVDKLDEIDHIYTEEDIEKSLMANNYVAPTQEIPVVEETIEVLEETPSSKIDIIKLKLNNIKTKIVDFITQMPVKYKRIGIGILCLLIVIIGIFFVRFEIKSHTYNIVLKGDEEISLYEGGLYKENGVTAYNYKGNDKTNLVKINAQVDTDSVGEYKVTYTIKTFWKKNVITRKVTVLPNPLDDIYFTLNGDEEVDTNLGEEYTDAGYNIRSDDNEDYSGYVSVLSNVNTEKIGTYEVKYSIKINKKQQDLVRKVNVVGSRYSVKYNKNATRDNVVINIVSNLNNFDYFIVDGHKVLKDDIEYTVTSNGRYMIEMYDTDGTKDNIYLVINNIDRDAPTGTCTALYSANGSSTNFNLEVRDASKIATYKYNNNFYTSNSFNVNYIANGGAVTVTDVAGNSSNIDCSYYYAQINSNASNNVIQRFDGTTLKYWIEQPTSSYLITHIWVQDPYNQFKVALPKEFPQLERAINIMGIASNKYGYYSKAMIGTNASGFVTDTYNADIAKVYPSWKFSSKSPLVVVDGQVVRNYTNLKQVGGFGTVTIGMNSNGYLIDAYLNDPNDIQSNQKNAQELLNAGVRYTFAFGPYLIRNGQIKSDLSNDADVRQAIGQINKNNFVIITSTVGIDNRAGGMGYKYLAYLMYNLGCKTAYNTDGGGSTNLIYKNRNTNEATGIITTTRDVADILYFVEK